MAHENIYLIRLYNNKESFFKIGLSVHKYCRFYEIMKSGYEVDIIYMIFGIESFSAFKIEKHLQSIFPTYTPLIKFGGYTECFSNVPINTYKDVVNNILNSYEYIENIKISWR